MVLKFNVPNNGDFILELEDNNIKRFSTCKFIYISGSSQENMYEDYLYVFIENMLGRIKKIPLLKKEGLLGKLGEWQEYFYYDDAYIEMHSDEIKQMENSIFVSMECYGIFLYKFEEEFWIELNKGYNEEYDMEPRVYYSNPANYRILMAPIPKEVLCNWEKELEKMKENLF